eukprot:6463993-Karenia_brevis.AAC.1
MELMYAMLSVEKPVEIPTDELVMLSEKCNVIDVVDARFEQNGISNHPDVCILTPHLISDLT